MNKKDNINPSHYTQGDIECIDAIKAAVTNKRPEEAVLVGNIIKYLWRYEEKGGLESIKKAKWYLENLEREHTTKDKAKDPNCKHLNTFAVNCTSEECKDCGYVIHLFAAKMSKGQRSRGYLPLEMD